MTAPDMVSIIAAALRWHQIVSRSNCACGQRLTFGPFKPLKTHDDAHAAHQARAVLAAISEAGAVADPEVCGHALDSQGAEFGPKSPCTKPTGHDQYHRDNTGVAFGPYQGEPNE